MFSSHRRSGGDDHHATITLVRDVVEIVAILAAGIWAFYVFAYENRIRPSFAQPEMNIDATLQRLSDRNGEIAVGLHLELRNVGTVNAHFLGLAINVYGQRVIAAQPGISPANDPLRYEHKAFYKLDAPVPVYGWAYVTKYGNPKTGVQSDLDPGTSIENYRVFYVPKGKFDLLTVGIDAPYTKSERLRPTHLRVAPNGDVRVITELGPEIQSYNIATLTSLDIR
jgi:hypothetical protein